MAFGAGFIDIAVFSDGPVVGGIAGGPAVWFEVVEVEVFGGAETAGGVAEITFADVSVAFAF